MTRLLLCLVMLAWPGILHAAEKTPFWLEPRTNTIIDRQVAKDYGPRAGLFVLRAHPDGPAPGYAFADIATRLKDEARDVPVLSYALVTRQEHAGRVEAYLLRGLDIGIPLSQANANKTRFLDITDPRIRQTVIDRLVAERKRLRVDGFAVDLAIRTPATTPRLLATVCANKPGFCDIYARSMDDLLTTLNQALGEPGTLLYNGLWNLAEPGMLENQSRLLSLADAAAIEYFGLNPRVTQHGFRHDILSYLELVPRLPRGKPLLFFGRGPWRYTDYAADYLWQRYLFGAFLLARRPEDMFKYHATFQVPTSNGRTGGLDLYADWQLDLGNALGPYRVEDGLYVRDFTRGRVLVAPDDGRGGRARLASTHYTPEGQPVSGDVAVAAGEALILLSTREQALNSPSTRRIDAGQMAAWGWTHAERVGSTEDGRLRLAPLPDNLAGEHDVSLDFERSLTPFERLEVSARLTSPSSAVLAIAEVDDPDGTHAWAVVAVRRSGSASPTLQMSDPVHFRAGIRTTEPWPVLGVEYQPGHAILLDGPRLFGATKFRFRRWSHLRLAGPLEISAVQLDRRPDAPYRVTGTPVLRKAAPASTATATAR